MTYTEKVKMYEKMKKGELIKMLIEANNALNRIKPTIDLSEAKNTTILIKS
jgi:hypothetical protein